MLYRRGANQVWQEVAELSGPFALETTRTIVGPDPPAGSSLYMVRTGALNNGAFSESAIEVVR